MSIDSRYTPFGVYRKPAGRTMILKQAILTSSKYLEKIKMIGLSILAVLVTYIAITRFIVKRIKNRKIKYLLIAIFILIPAGDYFLGRIYLQLLCMAEGGLKIYETAEDVEGFLSQSGVKSADLNYFNKLRYKYLEQINIEDIGKDWGNIIYITLGETGGPIISYPGYLRSKHILMMSEAQLFPGLYKQQYQIKEIFSGKQLATATNFSFRGGWIKESLGMIGGPLARCPSEVLSPRKFLNDVLIPGADTGN